jgi:hypothetical protein
MFSQKSEIYSQTIFKFFNNLPRETNAVKMSVSKTYTTNYYNSFIEVAEDTKVAKGIIPPAKKDKKTIAELQFDLISKNPYQLTSDDVLFQVYADRKALKKSDYPKERTLFFSKGQACLRCSPLAKSYGFGIHFNDEGTVALYGMETAAYQTFLKDANTKKIKAMRTAKK